MGREKEGKLREKGKKTGEGEGGRRERMEGRMGEGERDGERKKVYRERVIEGRWEGEEKEVIARMGGRM